MGVQASQREAVQAAQQELGSAATVEEIAAFVERTYGHKLQPVIVKILLASLQEREVLDRTRRHALELIGKAREAEADGPAGGPPRRRRRPTSRESDAEKSGQESVG